MTVDTDWSLLGGNPAPGDVELIRKLASDYIEVAKGALDVSTGLGGPKGDLASVWSGGTAVGIVDQNIEAASDDLKKAFDSFSEAGTALRSHADSLETLQARALWLLDEAYAGQGQIDGAVSSRASFEESFRSTAADSGTSSLETEIQLRLQIGSYNDSVGAAEAGLDHMRWQADQLRDEHRTLGQATRRKIDAASEVGIQNAPAMSILGWKPFGDQVTWADFGHEFSEAYDDMKPWIVGAGLVIAVLATGGSLAPALYTVTGKVFLTQAGMWLSGTTAVNAGNKMLRKSAGDERVTDSWESLALDFSLSAASVGAGAHAINQHRHAGILGDRMARGFDAAQGHLGRSQELTRHASGVSATTQRQIILDKAHKAAQAGHQRQLEASMIRRVDLPLAKVGLARAEYAHDSVILLEQIEVLHKVTRDPLQFSLDPVRESIENVTEFAEPHLRTTTSPPQMLLRPVQLPTDR